MGLHSYKVFLLLYLAGVVTSASEPPNLRGVPEELRDKILAFHRVLNTPDNFTARTIAPATPPPDEKRYAVAGLQEASEEDEKRKREEAKKVKGELQSDLFRFSNKVSVPHSAHTNLSPTPSRQNFVSFMKRKERLRQRIQKEWRRFIKWRTQKRKKKRLKRRINRTLNKRMKKQFGRLGMSGKRTKEEVKAFKKRKKILKRKIRRRLRYKQKMNLRRQIPGQGSLPEQRLKKRRMGKGMRKGKRRKQGKRE